MTMPRTCRHCTKPIGYSMTYFTWVHMGTKAAYCNYPTSNSLTAQPIERQASEHYAQH